MKNQLKVNFKTDFMTGLPISIDEYRVKLRESRKNRKSNNCFLSEIADFYYKEKYSMNIVQVLSKFYEIPKCPITGDFVSYNCAGSIVFGKFSSTVSQEEMCSYIAKNNESYKAHIERMRISRKGDCNPRYGSKPWNKGLTVNDNEVLRNMGEKRRGTKHSEEARKKQSESAKKRKVHGHTGHRHSEASKQIMREKTINRIKNGLFPQTNSLPHRKVKELLEEVFGVCGKDFEEEFPYGVFTFDFKVGKYLIEVQGDFWHCNPRTRHKEAKHASQRVNVSRDRKKERVVNEKGEYTLIKLWEDDIINNIKKIRKCIQNLKK
jgi:hypothetical protein